MFIKATTHHSPWPIHSSFLSLPPLHFGFWEILFHLSMLSPWIHIHFLVHFLCSSQSGLLIVYMLPFICLPFFERLLMPAFLLDVCSPLSSLLLSPLLAVTDHHWLPKAFSDTLSDLPLPDHPKLSPLNSYRPLQLLCRSYQV